MTTTTPTDTMTPAQVRESLGTAEQEKAEAESLAAALAEQVRDGDPNVTPKKLADAQQLAGFAELRIEAARRKLTAAEEQDRQARAAQLAADARRITEDEDRGVLVDAVRQAAEAVAALVAVALPRNDRIRAVSSAIRDLDHEFEMAGALGQLSVRHGVVRHPEGVIVSSPKAQAMYLSAGELLAAAVRLGTGQKVVTEGELIEAFNGPDGTLARVLKAVPALAEQWRHSPEQWAQMDRRQQSHALGTRRAPEGAVVRQPEAPNPGRTA